MELRNLRIKPEVFKKLREKTSLSLRQLEEKTGVSRSTISNLENGANSPDGETLLRLMFFFDLQKEDIITFN